MLGSCAAGFLPKNIAGAAEDDTMALLRARGEACSVNACALATKRSKTEVNMIEDLRGKSEGVGCKQRTKRRGTYCSEWL